MTATSIFDACQPRQDILDGSMAVGDFAARLGTVISRSGPADYTDPVRFFANTYPTVGLRELLAQVLGRLSGRSDSPAVFRLDTSFGGGKTHGLIGLVHAARDGASVRNLGEFAPGITPPAASASPPSMARPPIRRTAGRWATAIAHSRPGARSPSRSGERPATSWSDGRTRCAAPPAPTPSPSCSVTRPVLVVLDELGEYLRKCPTRSAGTNCPPSLRRCSRRSTATPAPPSSSRWRSGRTAARPTPSRARTRRSRGSSANSRASPAGRRRSSTRPATTRRPRCSAAACSSASTCPRRQSTPTAHYGQSTATESARTIRVARLARRLRTATPSIRICSTPSPERPRRSPTSSACAACCASSPRPSRASGPSGRQTRR